MFDVTQVRTRATVLALGLLMVTSPRADSWSLPDISTHTSADGRYRFTVTPRALSGQYEYFSDKVEGKLKSGALAGGNESARGQLQRRSGSKWKDEWEKELLNDVAPVDVLVSKSGHVVTFDNWHTMGYGDDVIVVYDASGALVCSLGLHDLLPAEVVDNLPRSVSSIRWRKGERFSDDQRLLTITIASPSIEIEEEDDEENTFELALAIEDCAVVPPSAESWREVLTAAEQHRLHREKIDADWLAKYMAPLSAPTDQSEEAWNMYLLLAWHRSEQVDSGEIGYRERPAFHFLSAGDQAGRESSKNELKESLDRLWRSETLVVGSASPSDLVSAIEEIAPGIPLGSLRDRRVYFALPDPEYSAVRALLKASEVEILQIDPSLPIPQSERNLKQRARDEAERVQELEQREVRAQGRRQWWRDY